MQPWPPSYQPPDQPPPVAPWPDAGWPPPAPGAAGWAPPAFPPPGGGQASPPMRLTMAAAIAALSAVVGIGQIATLVYAVSYDPELLYIAPILLLVGWMGWIGFLAYGMLTGRPWIRKVTWMSMPLIVPFCVLYPAILGPELIGQLDSGAGLDEYVQLAAVLLCLIDIPLSLLPPILLMSNDVTAYLRRR